MRKTTIYVSESTEERLSRAARRLGKSRAEMVGMGENAGATARDYEERLAKRWTSERSHSTRRGSWPRLPVLTQTIDVPVRR